METNLRLLQSEYERRTRLVMPPPIKISYTDPRYRVALKERACIYDETASKTFPELDVRMKNERAQLPEAFLEIRWKAMTRAINETQVLMAVYDIIDGNVLNVGAEALGIPNAQWSNKYPLSSQIGGKAAAAFKIAASNPSFTIGYHGELFKEWGLASSYLGVHAASVIPEPEIMFPCVTVAQSATSKSINLGVVD